MSAFDPEKFSERLSAAYERSSFKSYAKLGEAVGVSRATISSYMGAKEKAMTGKASQPRPELVKRLAISLNEDLDEFLMLAGYAPRNINFPKELKNVEFGMLNDRGLLLLKEFIDFLFTKPENLISGDETNKPNENENSDNKAE